jgi:outer membrane lipoprotein-sorting protein
MGLLSRNERFLRNVDRKQNKETASGQMRRGIPGQRSYFMCPPVDRFRRSFYHRFMSRILLLLTAILLFAGTVSAQTVDEVISRYLTARGGVDKIKAVKTERITGKISFGADAEGTFVLERKRPLKMHMEILLSGQSLIRVYDGKSSGWIYNPFAPNPSVQPLSQNDLNNIFDEADFDGPFVDYKEKGYKIEFAGKADVLGKPSYKLKLTNKRGDVSYFYFDATSGLLVKWEGSRKMNDKDVPWETFFHEFQEVNGLKYPFLIESDAPGTDQTQRITAEKINVNLDLADARFDQAPAVPAPPSAPPAANAPATPAPATKPN